MEIFNFTLKYVFILLNFVVFMYQDNLTQFITLTTTMFFIIVLPTTNILYGSVLKAAVIVILLMIRFSSACCFTGQFIMIGNSVASHLRAAVHGLSTSTVCGARAISPTLAGSLFSWSITSGLGFPFNEKFIFIIYWICDLACTAQCLLFGQRDCNETFKTLVAFGKV